MIDVQGLSPRDPLHAHITGELGDLLSVVRTGKVPAKVTFGDEDGPRRGPAIRCTITLRIPRQAEVAVHEMAKTPRAAFDAALDLARRQVTQRKEARRDRARRPKKQYAAKQEIEGPTASRIP
jgi:ribosome-associated translation inhibitor RaiA